MSICNNFLSKSLWQRKCQKTNYIYDNTSLIQIVSGFFFSKVLKNHSKDEIWHEMKFIFYFFLYDSLLDIVEGSFYVFSRKMIFFLHQITLYLYPKNILIFIYMYKVMSGNWTMILKYDSWDSDNSASQSWSSIELKFDTL